jgi:hypothetical protein
VGGKNKNKSVPLIILKTLVPLNILYNKRSKPIDFWNKNVWDSLGVAHMLDLQEKWGWLNKPEHFRAAETILKEGILR